MRRSCRPLLPVACLAVLAIASIAQAQTIGRCSEDRYGPEADCGRLSVFEDRANASGRRIDIFFVRLRATRDPTDVALFMFAGGPGAASTSMARLANGPLRAVRAMHDIVLVDQRGTGGSNALICPSTVASDPSAAFGHLFDRSLIRRCRDLVAPRANVGQYLTQAAVQDIDDVREMLGYERVVLFGSSYGTRVAQAYMRHYPERVLAAVLDGVVPFDFTAPATYARTAQEALEEVFADCRSRAACRERFPSLEDDFASLVERLRQGPVRARVRTDTGEPVLVRLALGDFGYAVRGMLYRADLIPQLPDMIHHASVTGDLSPFAQRYWERAVSFSDGFADGLHLSVFCSEDVAFVRDDEIGALTADTFLGRYLIDEYRDACALWETVGVPEDMRRPLEADIPTLLVSGRFDPITAPWMGARVAQFLPGSKHIVVRNSGHGSAFGCAAPAVIHVLTRHTLDGLPAVC